MADSGVKQDHLDIDEDMSYNYRNTMPAHLRRRVQQSSRPPGMHHAFDFSTPNTPDVGIETPLQKAAPHPTVPTVAPWHPDTHMRNAPSIHRKRDRPSLSSRILPRVRFVHRRAFFVSYTKESLFLESRPCRTASATPLPTASTSDLG